MPFGSFFKKIFGRGDDPEPDDGPAPATAPPGDTAGAAPDPSSDAAPPVAPPAFPDEEEVERGWFARLRSGLSKTASNFTTRLGRLLRGKTKLDEDTLDEVEEVLHSADFGTDLTFRIMDEVRLAYRRMEIKTGDEVYEYIVTYLKNLLPPKSADPVVAAPGVPTVILVVGVNGTGKTTSIAKLAKLFSDAGKRVMLAAGDTFRAAAIEQLHTWADRVGVEIVQQQAGCDPAAVVHDACEAANSRGVDFLIIDTAGRLHNKKHLMRELEKIHRVAGRKIPGAPHEVLLVLDATTGQNAVSQARAFTSEVGVTGLVLTKLDGTAKGGVVIAIWREIQIPVKYVGTGERAEDIAPFDPEVFVDSLFERNASG